MNNTKINISVTIVLYKEDENTLQNAIDSFLNISMSKKLYLVDNSPTNKLERLAIHPDIEYIHFSNNIGFGSGHNTVIEKINKNSDFHLILNPDVTFKKGTIEVLVDELIKREELVMIAPKVLFPNNKHQYTARKYPVFLDLVIRRLNFFKNRIYDKEYRDKDLTAPFYVEYLTGCFQLYKTADFVALKGFDERYFLYMEDVDICKKIDVLGKKKLYYPKVSITHVLKQGSSKKPKLFMYHLTSAIKYFLKWR